MSWHLPFYHPGDPLRDPRIQEVEIIGAILDGAYQQLSKELQMEK